MTMMRMMTGVRLLTSSIAPSTVTGTRIGAGTATSDAAVATPTGGQRPVTYAWAYVSGDTVTVTSATSASTTFSKSLSSGGSTSSVYKCTITDAVKSSVSTVNVVLTSTVPAALYGTVSPSSVSGNVSGAGTATSDAATAAGHDGVPGYTYAWTISGATANSPSSAASTFSASLSNGGSFSGTASCRITDSAASYVDVTVPVSLTSTYVIPALYGSVSPSSLSGTRSGAGDVTTSGSATAAGHDGSPGYTYAWTFSGGTANSPTSATSTFTRTLTNGGSFAGSASCRITDSAAAYVDVTVYIDMTSTYVAPAPTVSASPTSVGATIFTAGTAVSNSTTATPSGGTPGYTYAWTLLSGDAITCDSPTSATTTFSYTFGPVGTKDSTFRCTVTDAASQTGYADVTVTLAREPF